MRRLLRWGKNPFTAISPHANNPGPPTAIVWRTKGGGGGVVPPGPVFLLEDTFTGADGVSLAEHVSDSGSAWVEHPLNVKDAVLDGDGYLQADNNESGSSFHYAAINLPSADYFVEAEISYPGLAGGLRGYARITARTNETLNTQYYVDIYRPNTGGATSFRFMRAVNGAYNVLAERTFTPSSTHTMRLEVEGSSLRAYLDGVLEFDVTDTAISAAGHPGVGVGYAHDTPPAGFLVDRLIADELP